MSNIIVGEQLCLILTFLQVSYENLFDDQDIGKINGGKEHFF